ncbi:MAG: primosomal protein N' [Ruminococcaceae bacterium]|nr:primosomal protein N' [Oscillospiraceae bacterium]
MKVAVEKAVYHFDKLYSYYVPKALGSVEVGCRIVVPFGGGNRRCQAIVMEYDTKTDFRKLKPVFAILDDTPFFTRPMLETAKFVKERTFCSLYDAAMAMVPPGMYMKLKPCYAAVRPRNEEMFEALSEEEQAIVRFLEKAPDGVFEEKLSAKFKHDLTAELLTLVQKGLIIRSDAAKRLASDATVRMARLTLHGDELKNAVVLHKCSEKQRAVLQLLEECGAASVKELCYFASVTSAVVTAVHKKGLIELYDSEVLRSPVAQSGEEMPPICSVTLSDEQQRVYEGLTALCDSGKPCAALLHGVTGSGKTQVYMNLIDHVLESGRTALVLVPEISLTPQMMTLFFKRYGKRVALLHSGLSLGERTDEWKRVRRGEASIVLGTRSAVFAPLENLGLIVVDEEQEHTYKSDSSPRYHTKDVVRYRCTQHNALMLLCSATPSVESYYNALSGRYRLFTLNARFGQAGLPRVQIVDMREQPQADGLLSEPLCHALEDCFANGKQAILLYNRRGYHTFVSCRSCGHVITCPSCSISMTYHAANNRLICHYCGRIEPYKTECPECGSDKVRYSGQGTQRIEEALSVRFPKARVLRMDADTTMSRFAYEEKFSAFARGEYDLMIGTQMVAKGLDFPNVSLVGVLSADMSLFCDDFRSFETTFALLTQVIGRAGRRSEEGTALVQTYAPENEVIAQAAAQDYLAFYRSEIEARRAMGYPPYTDLYLFGLSGLKENDVKTAAQKLLSILRYLAGHKYPDLKLIVLDPSPATVSKIAGKFRYKLLMKTVNTARLREMVTEALEAYQHEGISKYVSVYADVNPSAML